MIKYFVLYKNTWFKLPKAEIEHNKTFLLLTWSALVCSHKMSSFSFPEPPTRASLTDARRSLHETRSFLTNLSSKINHAEAELAQIIRDSKVTINHLQEERACLEEQLLHTMAYLSPIRRLPADLLSDIFMWSFDDYSCQAWILASVCSSWRRLALRMPRIWSKVRFFPFPSLARSRFVQVCKNLPQRVSMSSALMWQLLNTFPYPNRCKVNNFEFRASRPRHPGLPHPSIALLAPV